MFGQNIFQKVKKLLVWDGSRLSPWQVGLKIIWWEYKVVTAPTLSCQFHGHLVTSLKTLERFRLSKKKMQISEKLLEFWYFWRKLFSKKWYSANTKCNLIDVIAFSINNFVKILSMQTTKLSGIFFIGKLHFDLFWPDYNVMIIM